MYTIILLNTSMKMHFYIIFACLQQTSTIRFENYRLVRSKRIAYLYLSLMGLLFLHMSLFVCVCVCASQNRRETIITGSFYIKERVEWREKELAWLHSPYRTKDGITVCSVSSFIVVCSLMPTLLYHTYTFSHEKKRKQNEYTFLLSFSFFSTSLIRWTIKRWGWQWQARLRHAKCRLSPSVNRRTDERVISFVD